jgi:hypothetical protein
MRWLGDLKNDQLLRSARELLFSQNYVPAALSEQLRGLTNEASSNEAMAVGDLDEPFPEGWYKQEDRDPCSTGLAAFDKFLDGGHCRKESNGLLAATGSGKTTTMVALSTLAARQAYREQRDRDEPGPIGISYFFTWEEPVEALRIRALANLAVIPRKTIAEFMRTHDVSVFSTNDNLKTYEQSVYMARENAQRASLGVEPLREVRFGELSRYRWAEKILNLCWRIVDMTGCDERFPGRGGGLTAEVGSIIRQHLEAEETKGRPRRVDVVAMDYVGAAALRHMGMTGKDPERSLRYIINHWALGVKQQVAIPFDCFAWSCHQLSSDANMKPAGHVPHYTNSKEGRAFADNTDFTICYGTLTKEGVFVASCGKHRRTEQLDESLLQLDGELANIVDTERHWVLDRTAKTIISRDEAAGITSGSSMAQTPTSGSDRVVNHSRATL